ncbi:MAG: hypothetical protein INR73_01415 [Williamsia sp.]|nr:hypothetical protein [Williamsia sp.]
MLPFLDVVTASTAARVGVPLQQAMPFFVHWADEAILEEAAFAATGLACCATARELLPEATKKSRAEETKRWMYLRAMNYTE